MDNRIIGQDEFFKNKDLTYAYDSLTKVLNRDTVIEYMENLIERKVPFAFIILDMDNFKYINDTYGHMVGDKVLIKVGENYINQVKDIGVIGRFGGDEFIMVIPEIVDYDAIWKVCRKVCFSVNEIEINELMGSSMSTTIGLSRFPIDGENKENILLKADRALYRGKQKGRNCFIIYLHEKHANIDIGDSDKLKFKSMDLHAKVFKTLTATSNFADSINSLMHFMSSALMIDHLCIQSDNKVCCSVVYPISPVKSFARIKNELIYEMTNADGLCIINYIGILIDLDKKQLFDCLSKQKVYGSVYVKIEAYGKAYGVLRAESANQSGRIWQDNDVDILVVMAKLLGILLYYNNLDLDEIF